MSAQALKRGDEFTSRVWRNPETGSPLRFRVTAVRGGLTYCRAIYGKHDDGTEWLGGPQTFYTSDVAKWAAPARPSICLSCGHAEAYGSTAGGCPCTAEDKQRAAQALARLACPEGVKP